MSKLPTPAPSSQSNQELELQFQEVPSCYICDSADRQEEFSREFFGARFSWMRCSDCRLVYQQPKLTRESLLEVYNSPIYWGGGREPSKSDTGARVGYDNYVSNSAKRLAQAEQRSKRLEKLLPSGARVLDIGCAAGFFLKACQDRGLTPVGIDLSEYMAAYGRRNFGVDIRAGDFDSLEIEADSFDAVTAWGCDSNFFDPLDTFQTISRILRPGGYFVFNFFDFDHWARPLLGEFKMVYNALYYLNRDNARRMVGAAGLEIVRTPMEYQFTCLDEIFFMTGRHSLRRWARALNIHQWVLRLPILGSYLVIARKPS